MTNSTSPLDALEDFEFKSPLRRLICAVIKSGIDKRDREYFTGETFQYHCELVLLDGEVLRDAILKELDKL